MTERGTGFKNERGCMYALARVMDRQQDISLKNPVSVISDTLGVNIIWGQKTF